MVINVFKIDHLFRKNKYNFNSHTVKLVNTSIKQLKRWQNTNYKKIKISE